MQRLGLSARSIISASNILFLIAGLYFATLAGLGESSVYGLIATIVCFVSIPLGVKKSWFFSGPWRVGAAVFVLVLTVSQLISVAMTATMSAVTIGSGLINGVLFVVFLGVMLATAKDITKSVANEDEDETRKESKKITYEI